MKLPKLRKKQKKTIRIAALIITVCALIGMVDSTYLVLQYLAALLHPGEPTPCTVNTFVSCTKTVQGSYAHYFVIPNPILGMLWYAGLTCYGLCGFLGAMYTRSARLAVLIVILAGLLFSYRLYAASVLELGGVCPFCLLSTTVSTILFLAFVVDDRTSSDPIFRGNSLKAVYGFQIFSFLTFAVGLSWFTIYSLRLMPDPSEAMAHWSFPSIVAVILLVAVSHFVAFQHFRSKK